MDLAIFALHIMGASSIMGSINIITTILTCAHRDDAHTDAALRLDLAHHRVPPYRGDAVLAGAITMLLTDRHFGTSFFNAAGGGDPLCSSISFGFFGHPEVYIMILPASGSSAR